MLSPGRHTVTVTARAKSVSISDDSVENDLDSETVVVDIGMILGILHNFLTVCVCMNRI